MRLCGLLYYSDGAEPVLFGRILVAGLPDGSCCGLFAPVGDLVESIIKRSFEIKDSGNIFPGHGGVLDRFDSLLFTAPVVYYVLLFISIFRMFEF